MARENDNNQSDNSSNGGLNELREKIRLQKESIAANQSQVQKALELFKVIRDMRNEYGGLDDELKNQLKSVTEILKQNEQQLKNLEALENKAKRLIKVKKDMAAVEKAAAQQAQKNADKSIHNAEELETLQRSIGKTLGKNSKLYEQGQVFNEEMHTTLTSVSKLLKQSGKDQEKLTKESEGIINAYKEFYTGVQMVNTELAKGEIGIKEHAEAVKGLEKSWDGVLSTLNLTGKAGKKIEAVMTAAGVPIKKAGKNAEATKKHFEGIESAMDELGKSGIPLATELSDVVTSIGQGADASRIAFIALGAAMGALIGKIGPGFAQLNASLKAGNDILEEKINLMRDLAKLTIEGGFIPEKIGLERVENQISGQMEINKLAREGQFNISKIANERLQNEIETANNVNRAMIDAQYAAQRAAVAFNQQMESGAAAFKAAAKTARSGEALGNIKKNVALLQLAGISADNIADALTEASEILGKIPTENLGTEIATFSRRIGIGVSDTSQIANTMELLEGASLNTSLNLQEGMKALADKAGISFSGLMKDIASASKKMADYGIKNTKQLAKSVAFAKSLGTSYETIMDAGKNMVLNYQDSIKAEMQLSALLGKQVDLSEVRQRFYENDMEGAVSALRAQGLNPEDMDIFDRNALSQALGGMDLTALMGINKREGANLSDIELVSKSIENGNDKFLNAFKKAQQELAAQDAIISAKTAIIDAKLSGKITEAYLKSPGYLLYQNNLNNLAQQQASLTTRIADDWLNSPENLKYQQNLNNLAQQQAKLNAAIEKAFLSSKAYQDFLVEKERLDVRRSFTENLIPTLTTIGGGYLFNKLGDKLLSKFGRSGPLPSTLGGPATTGAGRGIGSMLTKAGPYAAGAAGIFSIGAGAYNVFTKEAIREGKGGITQAAGNFISGVGAEFVNVLDKVTFGGTKSLAEAAGVSIKGVSTSQMEQARAAYRMQTGEQIGVTSGSNQILIDWVYENRDMLTEKGMNSVVESFSEAINSGDITVSSRIMESQEAATKRLEEEISFNRQVDVSYYSKMLKLTDEQTTELKKYNEQALSPEWLKEAPSWWMEKDGGGFGSRGETYAGSNLPQLSAFGKGDKEFAKYGTITEYFRDQAGVITPKTRAATIDEWITQAEIELGKRFTKNQVEKMMNQTYKVAGNQQLIPGSPAYQTAVNAGYITPQAQEQSVSSFYTGEMSKKRNRIMTTSDEKLTPEELQLKRGYEEGNRRTVEARQRASEYLKPVVSSTYVRKPVFNIPSNIVKNPTEPFIAPQQPDPTSWNYGSYFLRSRWGLQSGLQSANQTQMSPTVPFAAKEIKEGVTGAKVDFQDNLKRSPSLGVTLDKDNSGLFSSIYRVLSSIQSQADTRGIIILSTIKEIQKGISDGITTSINDLKDSVVGAINRLLVFSRASADSIKDSQTTIDNLARKGLGGTLGALAFPGYAIGTKQAAGGLAMVGEEGPELMYVPQSAAIIPNGDTKKLKAGDVSILSKWGIPGYADGKEGTSSRTQMDDVNTILNALNVIGSLGIDPSAWKHLAYTFKTPNDSYSKEKRDRDMGLAGLEAFNLYATGHWNHYPHVWDHFVKDISKNPAFKNQFSSWLISSRMGMSSQYSMAEKAANFFKFAIGPSFKTIGMGALESVRSGALFKMAFNGWKTGATSFLKNPVTAIASTLYSAYTALGDMDIQNRGLGGNVATNQQAVGNWTASLGANMYDIIDSWVTFGLLDKIGGGSLTLPIEGIDGRQTQILRGLWLTSNPDRRGEGAFGIDYVSNDELIDWVLANSERLSQVKPLVPIVEKVTNYADRKGIKASKEQILASNVVAKAESDLAKEKKRLQSSLSTTGFDAVHRREIAEINREEKRVWEDIKSGRRQVSESTSFGKIDPRHHAWTTAMHRADPKATAEDARKKLESEKIQQNIINQGNVNKTKALRGQLSSDYFLDSGLERARVNNQMPVKATVHQQAAWSLGGSYALSDAGAKTFLKEKGKKQIYYQWNPIKPFQEYIVKTDPPAQLQGWSSAPAYAQGVDSAPGGMAVVGEKGMEMMLHNGMASMIGVDGPEIRHVPKGAEIVPNHKLPAMAEGTMGATAAMMVSNTQQLMQIGKIIADAIVSKQEAAPAQNINLLVDGRQLANVQHRRQQNRLGMRPNDLV